MCWPHDASSSSVQPLAYKWSRGQKSSLIGVPVVMQGVSIPKLLKQGYYNYGLQACVVIARGGDILTEATLRASPHLAQQALNALASVHRHGLLHGDVSLHNFVATPDRKGVWVLDFALSCIGDVEECASEYQAFAEFLDSL